MACSSSCVVAGSHHALICCVTRRQYNDIRKPPKWLVPEKFEGPGLPSTPPPPPPEQIPPPHSFDFTHRFHGTNGYLRHPAIVVPLDTPNDAPSIFRYILYTQQEDHQNCKVCAENVFKIIYSCSLFIDIDPWI